jgi:hypothetical protein
MLKIKRYEKGLTLVELLVSMSIGIMIILLCSHTYFIIKQQEQRVRWQQDVDQWLVSSADALTPIVHQIGFGNTASSLNIQKNVSGVWVTHASSVASSVSILVPSIDSMDSTGRKSLVSVIDPLSYVGDALRQSYSVASGTSIQRETALRLENLSLGGDLCTPSTPMSDALCQYQIRDTEVSRLLIQPSMLNEQLLGFSIVLNGGPEHSMSGETAKIRTSFRLTPLLRGMPFLRMSFRIKHAGGYQFMDAHLLSPSDWGRVDAILLDLVAIVPTPRGHLNAVSWFTSSLDDASGRPQFETRRYRVLIPK